MKYFKKIEGEHIYLSPMNEDDIETYTKWVNDNKVTDGLGNSSKLFTVENERDWLIKNNLDGRLQLAIVRKDNDTLIGNCGFNRIDNLKQTATVGIFIGEEENRGKGYGTEAMKLLVQFGFEYLNLNNIMLKVFSFNEGAIKSYQKCGFKEFGRRHEVYPLKNKWYDEIYMEILKKDYFRGK